jgi:hypothetical protein
MGIRWREPNKTAQQFLFLDTVNKGAKAEVGDIMIGKC